MLGQVRLASMGQQTMAQCWLDYDLKGLFLGDIDGARKTRE